MENPLRAESPSILQEKSGRGNRPYMENFDHFKLRCDDSLGLGKNFVLIEPNGGKSGNRFVGYNPVRKLFEFI